MSSSKGPAELAPDEVALQAKSVQELAELLKAKEVAMVQLAEEHHVAEKCEAERQEAKQQRLQWEEGSSAEGDSAGSTGTHVGSFIVKCLWF